MLEGLSLANVAFNAPKTLRVHGTAVIQLLLSGEQPIEQLQDQLTELGEKAFERSLDVRVTLERALERVPLGQLAMALDSVAHPARRLGAEQAKKAG